MTEMPDRDIVLRNVRLGDGGAVSIVIEAGRIAAIGAAGVEPEGVVIDGGGALVLSGLVEAHIHLDKSLWGLPWQPHRAGPRVIDRIETERRMRKSSGVDVGRQAARIIELIASFGSTHVRSHVDIDTDCRLSGLEAIPEVRERAADLIDIELVAFPQSGLLSRPGTVELVEDALRAGADVVGGVDPAVIDRDPKGYLDTIFDLADRFGKPVDLHLHEPGELGLFEIELIMERTMALAMQGRVTISHAFCLGTAVEPARKTLFRRIAEAGIAIVTTGPAAWPAPPVKELVEAGVLVCCGNDNIRDAWSPYGSGDMLERAMLVGMRNDLRSDADLDLSLELCTVSGAKMMNVEGYGLAPGCWADLVLVDAQNRAEAVVAHPPRRLSLKKGRIVAQDGQLKTRLRRAADRSRLDP